MSTILTDFRFGIRMILKRPGTAALGIFALALGIGLTTLMFSIVQGVFLRGLPFDGADRLLVVTRLSTGQRGDDRSPVPVDDFLDWRATQHSFEALAGFDVGMANLSGEAAPERVRSARITVNTLSLLRVAPRLGRDFDDADARPGAAPVALISSQLWHRRFNADPGVLGRAVRVDGVRTTVVGVLGDEFKFPATTDVGTPRAVQPAARRGEGPRFTVFGRLRPGVTIEAARAEFAGIASRLAAAHPENKDQGAAVDGFIDRMLGREVVNVLSTMLAAVFGVLLIACANVGSLQLARVAERTREVAVRAALGAGRARIVRQLLIEGLLMSGTGAVLGMGLAAAGIALFNRAIVDTGPPFWLDIRIDATVVVFVVGLTLVAALAASVVPALRVTRQDLNVVLKDEGRANTSLNLGRFSRGLVVAEVLLSCCLLSVSGLMIKSIVKLGHIAYPYRTDSILVAELNADEKKYPTDADRLRLADEAESALRTVPGARVIGLATATPENSGRFPAEIEGQTYARPEDRPIVRHVAASPSFFDALGIQVLRGRGFTPADRRDSLRVALVTEDLARTLFPDRDPIGARLKVDLDHEREWRTIVGVLPRLVMRSGRGGSSTNPNSVYVPLAQFPSADLTLVGAAQADPLALTPAVRAALGGVDPDLPLNRPRTLADLYWQNGWAFRVFGGLFLSFGIAALVLAVAGLYGVMSFTVRRRTPEIGVRMALGAGRGRVVRMVVWQGLWRVALGVALGLVPAWFLAGFLSELLYDVPAHDGSVFGGAVAVLLLSGLAASLVPAARAASVDPLQALREE
jgi:predicted permease